MLAMLSLLQVRRDWAGQALAERLAVSTRTVRRDVDRLRELGYRIDAIKGPDGGYRLAAGAELPPLLFDEDQAVALSIALRNASASGADLEEAAARALATVRQVMPSRLRHWIDGIEFDHGVSDSRVDAAVLGAVSDAIRRRMVLRFDYAGGDGNPDGSRAVDGPPRRTEPHGLVARDGRWYLVAWDLDRGDWRLFRVDRLAPRTPAGPSFTPRDIPSGDARAFVAARFRGSTDEVRWPCAGEVVIHLPARAVRPWVADGVVDELDEATCRVSLGSWSWMGLLASIARFDAPFEIVGPPELMDAAAALERRMRDARPHPTG